jgi:hypothetical protein
MADKREQEPSKPKGWFSRRHPTNAEHIAARGRYASRRLDRPRQTWDHQIRAWIKKAR